MKLCVVTPAVIKGDGQGRANYEIVLEAIRRGHHVTLIATSVAPDLQHYSLIQWVPIPVKQFPTQLLKEIFFSYKSAHWLQRHRQEFDLVQVYGAVTFAPANINTVQFVHGAWFRSPVHISKMRRDFYGAYQWIYTALNAHWEKQSFQKAKVMVAVSKRVQQELIDIGIHNSQIRVIYNGVDVQEFVPGSVERSQWGLPENVPIALFAGDLRTNRKNLDTVLKAMVQLPDLYLAVVGAIAGSPYPMMAKKLGLSSRVHFLDFRRDISEIMKAVDLFVFPSRYEPFGMVVSEAMATGLPVVTAKTTGAAEIVTSECGIVIHDSEDALALAEALRTLTRNRDLRIKMGQAARSIAEQHCWSSKAQAYVDLFEEMVGYEN
jgi:glycosyltransferase involved in cell wall biosynthesis